MGQEETEARVFNRVQSCDLDMFKQNALLHRYLGITQTPLHY